MGVSDELREDYAALDLTPGASPDEVKAAYIDLVKIWHPDRYAHESPRLRRRAEEKLKEINAAYDRLRANNPRPNDANYPAVALTPLDCGQRWGYADASGRLVILPEFESARPFFEGLAAVRVIEKWGYIDGTGNLAIHPLYEVAGDFHEGLAAVRWRGRWGYINTAGSFVLVPRYQDARPFANGWGEVRMGERWGRVNRAGQVNFTPPKQI